MKWASTFKYIRINYGEKIAKLKDTTQRVTFTNNISGNKVKVRFSNKYETENLTIEKAVIGKISDGSDKDITPLTLGGKSRIVLKPGEQAFSDEAELKVEPGDKLFVSLYFKDEKIIGSICCYWSQGGTFVDFYRGDQSSDKDKSCFEITSEVIKADPNTRIMSSFIGFDAVQVLTNDETRVLAAFGDSITHMSFYTDALYKRICSECFGCVSLINSGIGGNRLVSDATYIKEIDKQLLVFGEAGIKRFEEDVFGIDEVDAVCALIGINDIMHPLQLEGKDETTSSEDIIDGLKKIINCAHENGAEIYLGTIMPSWNDEYPDWWLQKFEKVRNEVNSWIRKGELHDGVMDFDAEMSDEADRCRLKSGLHIGDGLHPNTPGGERMAKVVDIQTIACPRSR